MRNNTITTVVQTYNFIKGINKKILSNRGMRRKMREKKFLILPRSIFHSAYPFSLNHFFFFGKIAILISNKSNSHEKSYNCTKIDYQSQRKLGWQTKTETNVKLQIYICVYCFINLIIFHRYANPGSLNRGEENRD